MEKDNSKYLIPTVLVAAFLLFGCVLETVDKDGNVINPTNTDNILGVETTMTTGQLIKEDITIGTGDEVKSGDKVKVNYTGTLSDGTQFDTSIGREPFEFSVGLGEVIQGWDEGLLGMKVGGKRKLVIPPNLAYGSQDMGTIPANSTLTFEVDLIEIVK
jgi:FKBP-type peptidyl-prolyl cis-trans isomerase